MGWSAELHQYPDHVAIIPMVNQTNYWYNIDVSEISKTGVASTTNETYTGNLYQFAGGMDPWGSNLLGMLWINLMIRLFSLICLAFMASSTNRWVSDKIARCSMCCFARWGICHRRAFTAPVEEINPPFRVSRTRSGLQGV